MKLFIPFFFAATLALVNIASGQAIVENPKGIFCSAQCQKFMDKHGKQTVLKRDCKNYPNQHCELCISTCCVQGSCCPGDSRSCN
ncbi:hypothetical protein A4X13_0g7509 [Tilletia indica]|uniref:Uncharacterized protein n=1 Tax=Tilletia indica TaxID=43049 RepID=A0A177T6L7_9BASI|nr:hypothetical protein A4X13_0g7509 [Tilletia indica]